MTWFERAVVDTPDMPEAAEAGRGGALRAAACRGMLRGARPKARPRRSPRSRWQGPVRSASQQRPSPSSVATRKTCGARQYQVAVQRRHRRHAPGVSHDAQGLSKVTRTGPAGRRATSAPGKQRRSVPAPSTWRRNREEQGVRHGGERHERPTGPTRIEEASGRSPLGRRYRFRPTQGISRRRGVRSGTPSSSPGS